MSTKHPNVENHGAHNANGEPFHGDVAFESRDIKPSTIYAYLTVLAVSVILSYAVCVFIFRSTASFARQYDTAPPPVRAVVGENYNPLPPQPRLQDSAASPTDAQYDHRVKLAQDNAENNKLGWIDETNGIAQIPVKDAMKIIAEKGLPAASGAPQAKTK